MSLKNHLLFWSMASLMLIIILFVFNNVLVPFVLGMVIAYLLNPAVNALGRIKLSRKSAAMIILADFFLVLGLLGIVIVPPLLREIMELSDSLPGYIDNFIELVKPYVIKVQRILSGQNIDIKEIAGDNSGTGLNLAANIAKGVLAGGTAILDIITLFIIVPVVAYFMMESWPRITEWVKNLMPRDHKDTIMDLISQIDKKIAGFIRGQITVAFVLGVAYALALSLAGLKYGFIIGLMAGVLSIIPLVGSTVGLLVSVGVAWFQTGELTFMAVIAGIFLAGQVIEGNFLTPKLVGDSVGLHPLWIFFALLAGGSLFGILGMLIAVPVAAVVSVLVAFGLSLYKQSLFYKSSHPQIDHDEENTADTP